MLEQQVDTKCPKICHALVNLAREHRWTGSMFHYPTNPDIWLYMCFKNDGATRQSHYDQEIHGSEFKQNGMENITIEQAIEKIIRGPKVTQEEMPFSINGLSVIVKADCVKIGFGTIFSKEEVTQIYEAMMCLQGKN